MANPLLLNIAILVFACVVFIVMMVSAIRFNSAIGRLDDSFDRLGDNVGRLGRQHNRTEIHNGRNT